MPSGPKNSSRVGEGEPVLDVLDLVKYEYARLSE